MLQYRQLTRFIAQQLNSQILGLNGFEIYNLLLSQIRNSLATPPIIALSVWHALINVNVHVLVSSNASPLNQAYLDNHVYAQA